jgi:hydroxymethylglutaryl-CoA synthase
LTVGYGSGDASEAIPMEFVSGWESAAAKIGFKAALSTAHDLTRAQYEALHDGRWDEVEADLPRSTPFAIVRVGEANKPEFQDIGIEYYTFTG